MARRCAGADFEHIARFCGETHRSYREHAGRSNNLAQADKIVGQNDFTTSHLRQSACCGECTTEQSHVAVGKCGCWMDQADTGTILKPHCRHFVQGVLKSDSEADAKADKDPGPLEEVIFWESHAANLNFIWEQLNSEKVRKVLKILEVTKNTHLPSFVKVMREVHVARREANHNAANLKPMRQYFHRLSTDPFPSLPELFPAIMHMLMLVWKRSAGTAQAQHRHVSLIRGICNDIIRQVCLSIKFW